ncbi:MAG: HEAT repeat domain-containing protein [Bryobacteraceae bacterium]
MSPAPDLLAAWRGTRDAGARRRAAGLLLARDTFFEALADRSLSAAEALELARDAAEIDPQLDRKLAQRLDYGADDETASRLLDVLEGLAEGARLGPLIAPLLGHASPRVRSKAALLLGKANRSGQWAGRQFADNDARVRANIIEGLWGDDSAISRVILAQALADPEPRVAGNAAVGLYELGDTRSIAALARMAAGDAPERATAAWCMGRAGDRRFLPALNSLLRDPDPRVRQNALRAVSCIRRQPQPEPALKVAIFRAWNAAPGARRLAVSVVSAAEWSPVKVAPTGFLLERNGEMVTDYQVLEAEPPEALAVGFALPRRLDLNDPWRRTIEDTLLRCARLRRAEDTWAVLKYAPRGAAAAPADPARLTAGLAALAAAIAASGNNQGGAAAVLGRLLSTLTPMRGGRHLVFAGDPGPLGHERARLVMEARAARVEIHGIAPPEGSAELDGLCRATGGAYCAARSAQEASELIERLCIGMLHRYVIAYGGRGPDRSVRVEARVGGLSGCAEIRSQC